MANFSKRPSASGRLESAPGLSLSAPNLFGALRKIDLRIRPKGLKKLISVWICLLPRFDRGDFLSIAKVTLGPLLKLKMSVEPFYLRSLSYDPMLVSRFPLLGTFVPRREGDPPQE